MKDLEALLHENALTAIPDAGFTDRVLNALPARALRARPWVMPVLVLGSAAVGSAFAVALAPAGDTLLQGFADLVALRGWTSAAVTGIGICGALLASALVLAAASD
jgi:hypothetical protein